jgi:hypothetical protein
MRRVLLKFGWVRSIGAVLTLVGVAVVFVVVILPTTALGSAKSAKGGSCKTKFKSFTTDKAFRSDEDNPGEEDASVVAIFGSNLDHVDAVQFGGPSGKEWISASSWTFISGGGGYIQAQASADSVGVKGRIRLVDTTGSGTCYATSKSEFTPTHAS